MILSFVNAQSKTDFVGYIFDEETKEPLPYVNIGFINESIGTVSDDYGRFNLSCDPQKISNNSILQISFIGYNTIKLLASDFFAAIAKDDKFYLHPEPYNLDEVVLSNDLRKERLVGTLTLKQNTVGYWLNPEALGGEIATKIPIEKVKTQLHELKFFIVKNNSGWIKVRVNVYEYINGMPGKNLLTQNIYHTIKINSGIETINLEPYNVIVNNDIVVSLELIKVYGTSIDFEIGGSNYKTHSYTRLYNQNDWKRFPDIGLTVKLRTSFPSSKGKVIAKKRKVPNRAIVYWDASLASQEKERNIEQELNLLEKYLKEFKSVAVKIVKFSALTLDEHEFYLTNGNTSGLIEYLRNTDYVGEASFSNVLKSNDFEADVALLFTNAETILEPLEQSVYLPSFCINSNPKANHSKLQETSFYGDGYYINLSKESVKDGLEMMLTEYQDNESYDEIESVEGLIKGKVLCDSKAIPNTTIRVKNTLKETLSDKEGRFSINADQGDVLQINALGMEEQEIVLSNNSYFEVNLTQKTTVLNDVTVYGKTQKKVENTVLTPYGERNVDAIGYTTNEMTNEDISPGDTTFDQVIAKIPGIMITGVGNNKRYSFLNNVSSSTGIFVDTNPIIVIDNMIYHQKDGLQHLPPIDIQSIQSVRAIKSLAGTNRYGSEGAYGAIEIRTKASEINLDESSKTREDSALVKGNDYVDEGISIWNNTLETPYYLNELKNAATFEEAKTIYFNQKKSMPISIPYIINISDYFKKWNGEFAYVVLTEIASVANENVKALKTLAFKQEELNHFKAAKLIYERIAKLLPKDAQSYRNLALIYQKTDNYKEAMQLYKLMLSNSIEGIDFSGLQQVITNELKLLLSFHKSKVDVTGLPLEYLSPNFKIDRRLVFEWNDPTTEFELQFVNPQKKYYKWSHTLLENKTLMYDEINNGFSVQDFVIDDDLPGEWTINLKTPEQNESINPTYLKYTIYENFGLPNQTKKVKVIELDTKNQNVTLEKLMYQ